MNPEKNRDLEKSLPHIVSLMYLVILILVAVVFIIYQIFNTSGELLPFPSFKNESDAEEIKKPAEIYTKNSDAYWQAPDVLDLKGSALEAQILYGRELIIHTAKYLGPKGSVAQISNGMNCQNCHLEAGTKIFGNNYGSVASTFPKFRARSGSEENVYKRVNDCFERSLNGIALDTNSVEMQAIKAYMLFLGKKVEKGTIVKGSGLKDVPFIDRAADPLNGKGIYMSKCASCHQANGEGILTSSGDEYTYPPLWGKKSYNDAAGLYRLSNFAKYAKFNMPLGATYEMPQLSDEEAWDLSAFVNTQPRPHKETLADWPDIGKKPIDHPLGPFNDSFTEKQHKFGPFKPIADARKKSK